VSTVLRCFERGHTLIGEPVPFPLSHRPPPPPAFLKWGNRHGRFLHLGFPDCPVCEVAHACHRVYGGLTGFGIPSPTEGRPAPSPVAYGFGLSRFAVYEVQSLSYHEEGPKRG